MEVCVRGKEFKVVKTKIGFILYLNDKKITSFKEIEGLGQYTELVELHLSNNQISMIEGLDQFTNLQVLDLSTNKIKKIEGLDNLINLQGLDLNNNQITKIEGLNQHTNLRLLNLNHNQIQKIEGLDQLRSLQVVCLSDNQIPKIEGLEQIPNLRLLDLSRNQVDKLEGVSHLTYLDSLGLRGNPIWPWIESNAKRYASSEQFLALWIKKFYKRKEEGAGDETERLEKLQRLIRVSNRVKRSDIAQYLGISNKILLGRLVEWAERFGFKIDGEDVDFTGSQTDSFIAALDEEFRTWGKIKEKKV